ncbi:MAG: PD40 domain-containing protein [Planctomycetota bacterium]|nr:MAG: PD40 domain-containing protein [Planctomycetota bacterium]
MSKKTIVSASIAILIMAAGCQVPTGTIVFSRLTGDYWQIWTMQPDGKATKQITTSPSDKRYPIWAEDGKKILFRTNNNKAFIVDVDSREEKKILESFGLIGSLSESPDGSRVVFVRYKDNFKDSSNLWISTPGAKMQKVLTRDTGLQYDPAWSHDGRKIAYVSGHGFQTHELYMVNPDGKNKCKITDNKALEVLPAFSPDGNSIAYVSDITDDFEIWLMDIDGSNTRQITNSSGIDTRPFWSPDGDKIVFVSNRSGQLQLWIMNKDGSSARQLTSGAPSMDPAWKKESF